MSCKDNQKVPPRKEVETPIQSGTELEATSGREQNTNKNKVKLQVQNIDGQYNVTIDGKSYECVSQRKNAAMMHIVPEFKRQRENKSKEDLSLNLCIGDVITVILKDGTIHKEEIKSPLDLGNSLFISSDSYMAQRWSLYLIAYAQKWKTDNLDLNLETSRPQLKEAYLTEDLENKKALRNAIYKTRQVINNNFTYEIPESKITDEEAGEIEKEIISFPKYEGETDLNRELRIFKYFLNLDKSEWAQIYSQLEFYYRERLIGMDLLNERVSTKESKRERKVISVFRRIKPVQDDNFSKCVFVQVKDYLDEDTSLSYGFDEKKFIEVGISSTTKCIYVVDYDGALKEEEIEDVINYIKEICARLSPNKPVLIYPTFLNHNTEPKKSKNPLDKNHFQIGWVLEFPLLYLNDRKNPQDQSELFKYSQVALEEAFSIPLNLLSSYNEIEKYYNDHPKEEIKEKNIIRKEDGKLYLSADYGYTYKYCRRPNRQGVSSNYINTYYFDTELTYKKTVDPYFVKNNPLFEEYYNTGKKRIKNIKRKERKKYLTNQSQSSGVISSCNIDIGQSDSIISVNNRTTYTKPSKETLFRLRDKFLDRHLNEESIKNLSPYLDNIRWEILGTSRKISVLLSMDSIICSDKNNGIDISLNKEKYYGIGKNICALSCLEKTRNNEILENSIIEKLVNRSINFVDEHYDSSYLNNKKEFLYTSEARKYAQITKTFEKHIKIILVHSYIDQGYTIRETMEITGLSKNTVCNYKKLDVKESIRFVENYITTLEEKVATFDNSYSLSEKYLSKTENEKNIILTKVNINKNRIQKAYATLSMINVVIDKNEYKINNTDKTEIRSLLSKTEELLSFTSHISDFNLQQAYLDIVDNDISIILEKLIDIIEISNIEKENNTNELRRFKIKQKLELQKQVA